MKFTNRSVFFAIALAAFSLCATIFSATAGAQDEGWRILRAEYGTKTKHNDVTDIVKDLIGRGGVNGRVAVSNQTMGGDPAVGADKALHIFAKKGYEEREFDYKEGGFVEVRLFDVREEDWEERGGNYGRREREDYNAFRILRAFYGVQGKMVNVTELLRNRARGGSLSFVVTNSALGGDPAVGYDKVLIVVYRHQGSETATVVREGNTLTLP
jgi:hypothetical protein